MQQITLIGNIGQDCERVTNNGTTFNRFSLACNNSYKDKDGNKVDETNWYSIITRQDSLVPYLKKGTKIFLQGNLNVSVYKNKDGVHVAGLNVNANTIQLLDSKKESTGTTGNGQTAPLVPMAAPVLAGGTDDDDLPF